MAFLRFSSILVPALLALVSAAACGGGSGGSGGSGSGTGPIPLAADGAWTLTLTQDPGTCPLATHTAAVGQVGAKTFDQRVTDGQAGAVVTCSTTGTGPYVVRGRLDDSQGSGGMLEIDIPAISPAGQQQGLATGTLTYASVKTAGVSYTGGCTFFFVPDTPQTVDTGKIWVSFSCNGLTAPGASCPVTGVAAFENCATESGVE